MTATRPLTLLESRRITIDGLPQISTLEAYPNLAQSVIRQWEFCRFGSPTARDWLSGYLSGVIALSADIDDYDLFREIQFLINIVHAP